MTSPLNGLGPLAQGALPAVDPASLPREVREGGPEARRAYQAALGFERQLTGALLKAATPQEEGEGSSAATGAYRDMASDALADAIAAGGGLGLAGDLYRALRPEGR